VYLAIDLGGTFIKYGLLNEKGQVLNDGKIPTPKNSYNLLIDAIIGLYNNCSTKIDGLAISLPGTVDVNEGIVYYGGSLRYLHEKNLKRDISEKTNIPVSVENDAKCAALAEYWNGVTQGHPNNVVLVFGTGVGGGVMVNGNLVRGHNLSAGEVSFIIDKYDKTPRIFGRSGSASEMVNKIAKEKNLAINDGQGVFEYINNLDEYAEKIFNEFCLNIAVQIINFQYILDPSIIAIGGGISEQPIFKKRIIDHIKLIEEASEFVIRTPKIEVCHYKNKANLVGALYHHLTEYKKQV
jgi:predicted NBD/HSP70 family sugar kinase